MGIPRPVFSFFFEAPFLWGANWAWGLPLVVITVMFHVFGLSRLRHRVSRTLAPATPHKTAFGFGVLMGTTTMMAAGLHGLEAGIWAAAYRLLGALPDSKSAMLYSLNAMTSYGHANLDLAKHWQLMGAIEALNGWLLFGLSTAFLFGMIERVWLLDSKQDQKQPSAMQE